MVFHGIILKILLGKRKSIRKPKPHKLLYFRECSMIIFVKYLEISEREGAALYLWEGRVAVYKIIKFQAGSIIDGC